MSCHIAPAPGRSAGGSGSPRPGNPGPAPAGGPEQVGVLGRVGAHELAVGGHHVDGDDALAGPAPRPGCSSPARPGAGSRRGRPTRSGRRGTRGRAAARNGARSSPPRTAGRAAAMPVARRSEVAQPAQVDQQRVVAQAPAPPRSARRSGRTPSSRARPASRTPATTSSSTAATSTAAGNRSGRRALKTRPTAGLARSPGRRAAAHRRPRFIRHRLIRRPPRRRRPGCWPRSRGRPRPRPGTGRVRDVLRLPPPAQRDARERSPAAGRPGPPAAARVCGVSVIAGLTALTRMPCGPPSTTSW